MLPQRQQGVAREVVEGREAGGEGGSGTQNFVHRKWPDKTFPFVNFVFPQDGHFGLGGGGAPGGGVTPPLRDIPSGCCSFTGPWTVTRSALRMLRRVAAFCRPLRPVLLLVSFPRSQSPVVGVLGLCWMWQNVPFARQRRPIVGVLRMCWLLPGSFDCFCCPPRPPLLGRCTSLGMVYGSALAVKRPRGGEGQGSGLNVLQ